MCGTQTDAPQCLRDGAATRPLDGPYLAGGRADEARDEAPSTLEMDVDELQSRLKWQASLPVFEQPVAKKAAAAPLAKAAAIPRPPKQRAPMQHLPPRRRTGGGSGGVARKPPSGALPPGQDAPPPPARSASPPSGSQPRFDVLPAPVAKKKPEGNSRLLAIAGVLLGLVVLFGGGMALVMALQDSGEAQQVVPAAVEAPTPAVMEEAPAFLAETPEQPANAASEDAGSGADSGLHVADAGAPDVTSAVDTESAAEKAAKAQAKRRKRRRLRRKHRRKEGPSAPPIVGRDDKQAWD